MKRYKQAKRGTYKARTRKTYTYEICDGRDRDTRTLFNKRIHIPATYDGYKHTEYIADVYKKERDNSTHTYISMTNAMNEIFPEINAPHNAHTQRGTAQYRKFIPQPHNHISYNRHVQRMPRYLRDGDKDTVHRDTRRVKCILLYKDGTIAHMGIFRRTRITRTSNTRIETEIYLHRNDRKLQVYEGIPPTKIYGMTPKEIKAHDVEMYYI